MIDMNWLRDLSRAEFGARLDAGYSCRNSAETCCDCSTGLPGFTDGNDACVRPNKATGTAIRMHG
jgi:hypothetical protein